MMLEAAPEAVFERDNRPVPGGMPLSMPSLESPTPSSDDLVVVVDVPLAPVRTAKKSFGYRVSTTIAPIKNIKITLPKFKKKTKAAAAPKKAPVKPKRAIETNGHGII